MKKRHAQETETRDETYRNDFTINKEQAKPETRGPPYSRKRIPTVEDIRRAGGTETRAIKPLPSELV